VLGKSLDGGNVVFVGLFAFLVRFVMVNCGGVVVLCVVKVVSWRTVLGA
jgi:hypothetical protein